jgi:hypothetical protein
MQYGYGIDLEVRDGKGAHFHIALNPEERLFPDEHWGDISSLMHSMFGAPWAYPEQCQYFPDVREGVRRPDDPSGSIYDVLVSVSHSELPGRT